MSDWGVVRLGEVVEIQRQAPRGPLPYVGLEDIESGTGKLLADQSPRSVKSNTFFFNQTHVLYGRLRPYLNKWALPAYEGHCSTEIFPLKPAAPLLREYLAYWLSSNETCRLINQTARGARMPRANMDAVMNFEMRLPPLDEQKCIVSKLDAMTTNGTLLRTCLEGRRENLAALLNAIRREEIKKVNARASGVAQTLGELEESGYVEIGRGKVISQRDLAQTPGNFPVYSSSGSGTGEFGRYGKFMFDEEMVTWSVDGGGHLFYRPRHKFSVTNVGGWIRILKSDALSCEYLYEVLSDMHSRIRFDWIAKAHSGVIKKAYDTIYLPSLSEQQQVLTRLREVREVVQPAVKALDREHPHIDSLIHSNVRRLLNGAR